MTEFSSYIICATPRSGTTLLCDLLAGTGVAGHPNSYYRQQGVLEWAGEWGISTDSADFDRSYLDAVLRAGTGTTGVFGLRLMRSSVAELSVRLAKVFPGLPDDAARFERAFGRTLYVHLSRQDKIAQAVSRHRAEQTGLWHRSADGSERERTSPPQPPQYDADNIARYLEELVSDDAAWDGWFELQRIEPLRIVYEDLAANPRLVLRGILSALGALPEVATAASIKTARLADEISLEWTARFRRESRS